jgi:hypothetical protein
MQAAAPVFIAGTTVAPDNLGEKQSKNVTKHY